VNLLEKQLSNVYFKDVRLPGVTLYLAPLQVVPTGSVVQSASSSVANEVVFLRGKVAED